MATERKKKQKEKEHPIEMKISGLTEEQERLLIYAAVIVVILLLFALEPGFFLGVVIGVLCYRYYLDNYSKNPNAANR
jgi:hypothetical protein